MLKLNPRKIPTWQQVQQLPKFLNKKESFSILIALLILTISATILLSRSWLRNSIIIHTSGGSYTEGLIGLPRLINPILANSDVDRDLVKLIYSGLVKYDENGQIVPDLVEGYTIDAEKKIYTFELKDNISWHDKEPLTTDDIVFTIESIKNSEYKSPLKNSFNGVQVKKINDKTVQFSLEKPFSPFLSILTIGIIPKHLWYSIPAFGASLAELNIKPIGSGPYMFKTLIRDAQGNIKQYSLEPFLAYYNQPPFIEELSFKFYPDFQTGVEALENKNIEGLIYLPKENKDLKNKKVNLLNLHFPQYTGIFFNPNNNELLNKVEFREALNLSINKEKVLIEGINGDGQIIHTPILPGLLGYNKELKNEGYNKDKAQKILEELNYILPNSKNFRVKKGTEDNEEPEVLTIKLSTIDQIENVKSLNIIKENWEAIGIKTELEIITKDKIKETIESRDYQAFLYGEVININSGPYPFWHSDQNQYPGLNLSLLANKDIDKYLEEGRKANTEITKEEMLIKFQEKLLELHFAIFLYNPTYIYPLAKKIKGLNELQFINLPADRFNNINSWYIKTKRTLKKSE